MSDSSDEDDKRKVESTNRMWAESQPGPSRCQPSRQGYCGYCRVLYSNLDQHLSSLRHLDSVRASSHGSSGVSSTSSSRTKLTLLERFLQDVLQHHPYHYNDPRPSHADLLSISDPLLLREELDELCFPDDDDSRALDTREHLPISDEASCHLVNQQDKPSICSQSAEGVTDGVRHERLSAPIREQERGQADPTGHTHSSHTHTRLLHSQAPPSVHRKAHRKTDRRKTSNSSDSSPPPKHPGHRPFAPSELQPWRSWQMERLKAHKEEAFSSDHTDPLDQTIEEVIQMCCYGVSSTPCQQGETESFHFSCPLSLETQSDDWDSHVQVSQAKGWDLSHLMDVQVNLEDQVYSYQLDSVLRPPCQRAGGRARPDGGFWNLPIEEVLPAPEHIPQYFRGKTWAQVEQEDEQKVDKLVRQFRRGRFVCYFDSESLARYGRRSQNKKGEGSDTGVLPLLDQNESNSAHVRRKGRGFRMASRCQVVKVSHSTQTVRLVIPAVRQPEVPPTSVPSANQDAAERTPEVQGWRCLPPSYSNIITPLQPRTSLVYLLCSPAGPTFTYTHPSGFSSKRCRKKRRPLDLQGLTVKYKRLPVTFYDLSSNRILKNAPKGFLWRRGSTPLTPPPPCVRQLFRSLSPDLNSERVPGEGGSGSSRVKGQRSSDTFIHTNGSHRNDPQTDKQDKTSQAPSPPPCSRSERGRGGRRERTQPPPSKRSTRVQATPPQPRRGSQRRRGHALLSHPPLPRQGRGRRGRSCDKARR